MDLKSRKTRSRRKTGRKKTALLILDMLNPFDFPEAAQLLPPARRAAAKIADLKKRLKKKGVPVIYVNDNFGHWRSDSKNLFEICSRDGARGAEIARLLRPEKDDYFILKPKHSGFYSTNLEVLLNQLGVGQLILCGISGNICVLFTAHDAHMRDFRIIVPRDTIASNQKTDNDYALRQFAEVFGFRTPAASGLRI